MGKENLSQSFMVTIACRNQVFKNITAIIFDKDGTLENSQEFLRQLGLKRSRLVDAQVPGIGEPLLMAFGINGNHLDPTGLMAVGSRRENEIATAAYIAETGRGWLESRKIAQNVFTEADEMLRQSAPSPLFVGCLEVLQTLSQAGLKLGILSAAPTSAVEAFVQEYQLGAYLQLQQGVDDGPSKPDPRLFLDACAALQVSPGTTLMVGDSLGDMEMAKQAGAGGCIGICWNSRAPGTLPGADVLITQLDEIQIQDEP